MGGAPAIFVILTPLTLEKFLEEYSLLVPSPLSSPPKPISIRTMLPRGNNRAMTFILIPNESSGEEKSFYKHLFAGSVTSVSFRFSDIAEQLRGSD